MIEKKADENEELFAALGRFIVSFAEIEHWLPCLLGLLTDEDNVWLTVFFIDDLLTGAVRDRIRRVANLRLQDNEGLHERLKITLKEVEGLTSERNNIIHGQWVFTSTTTKLHNYKRRPKKVTTENGGYYWQRLEEKGILPRNLVQLTKKSKKLADDLKGLREEIKGYLKAEDDRIAEWVQTGISATTGA